jgi:hypothetical protein
MRFEIVLAPQAVEDLRALSARGRKYAVRCKARGEAVEVLAIVARREAQRWLEEEGTPTKNGGAGEAEG